MTTTITLSDDDYNTLTNALLTGAAAYDDLAAHQRQHGNPRLAEQFDRQATAARALLDRIEGEDAPTAEQLAALREYAALHGRGWKAALRADWMTACEHVRNQEHAGYLQQLRNTLGPKWLEGFRLEGGK